MATTCNFGQIKDLRLRNLCISGKVVIDEDLNLSCVNKAKVNSLLVRRNTTIKGALCVDGEIITSKITPKSEGIVICGNVDMFCKEISNIESIVVNNIYSKGLDVGYNTLNDVVRFASPPVFGVSTTGGGARNQFWGYRNGYSTNGSANDNISMGYKSLVLMEEGDRNISIGSNASMATNFSSDSVIIGHNASQKNTNNGQNVVIGSNALSSFVYHQTVNYYVGNAQNQVIIGFNAAANMTAHTTTCCYGDDLNGCVVIGSKALEQPKQQSKSVIIGTEAGRYRSWRSGENYDYGLAYNVVIGSQAAKEGVSYNSVIIGCYAGRGLGLGAEYEYQTYARSNVLIGYNSGVQGSTVPGFYENIALGQSTLGRRNDYRSQNQVALGNFAMSSCNGGAYNIAIGTGSLISASPIVKSQFFYNIVIGKNRGGSSETGTGSPSPPAQVNTSLYAEVRDLIILGHNSHGSRSGSGSGNPRTMRNFYTNKHIIIGNRLDESLESLPSNVLPRYNNIVMGHDVELQPANDNVAIGHNIRVRNNSGKSVAVGHNIIDNGYGSVSVGYGIDQHLRGDYSVSIGYKADTFGEKSIAIGNYAKNLFPSVGAIAIGSDASTDGNYGIALGYYSYAGKDYSIAIGYKADCNLTNAIAIGNAATPADAAHAFALNLDVNSVVNGGIGATTATLGVTINGVKYKIALTADP